MTPEPPVTGENLPAVSEPRDVAEAIVVPNTLWTSTDVKAYPAGLLAANHLADLEHDPAMRRDDARWGGMLEVIFIYLWAIVFRDLLLGGFVSMLVFVGILLIGLAYAWRKGVLSWR